MHNLEVYFQRCKKCGRWEPKEYLEGEKKHECPNDKSFFVPKEYKDGSHRYMNDFTKEELDAKNKKDY